MQGLVTRSWNFEDTQYWHNYNRSLERLAEPKSTPSVKIRRKGKCFNSLVTAKEKQFLCAPFNTIKGLKP